VSPEGLRSVRCPRDLIRFVMGCSPDDGICVGKEWWWSWDCMAAAPFLRDTVCMWRESAFRKSCQVTFNPTPDVVEWSSMAVRFMNFWIGNQSAVTTGRDRNTLSTRVDKWILALSHEVVVWMIREYGWVAQCDYLNSKNKVYTVIRSNSEVREQQNDDVLPRAPGVIVTFVRVQSCTWCKISRCS
jgi:hypothetical protein